MRKVKEAMVEIERRYQELVAEHADGLTEDLMVEKKDCWSGLADGYRSATVRVLTLLEALIVALEVGLHCVDVVEGDLVDGIAKLAGQFQEAELGATHANVVSCDLAWLVGDPRRRHLLRC